MTARIVTVRVLTLVMLLVMLPVLSLPLTATVNFPAIPLFDRSQPACWGLAGFFAMVALVRPHENVSIASVIELLLALILCVCVFQNDQHALQPWAWQATLISLIGAKYADRQSILTWWMRLACSIYIFSAISKLDVAFIDNLGRVIVAKGLAPALGLDPAFWSIELKRVMAASMPVVEVSAGIALWTGRWRRFGLWLATAMHVGLLTALGPLGLNHHTGVLVWNVFFAVHVWVLFHRSHLSLAPRFTSESHEPETDTAVDESPASKPPRFALREALLTLLLLLPIGEPLGLYDHWPGWSVYSNRPPIVRLEVAFPEPVTGVDWVGTPEPLTNLQIVSLSGWSYATWRTPSYPQERFQLAVIQALLSKLPDDTRFRVRVKTFSPLRTGQWSETVYESRAALAERLNDFWLPTATSEWRLPQAIESVLQPREAGPDRPTTGESISPD